MQLLWAQEAMQDRNDIFDYIALNNPAAAINLDELFAEKATQLIEHPNSGRAGKFVGTRELVVHTNYILIYDTVGEVIRILRVLHTARKQLRK